MNAKQRYDDKRRGNVERLAKERARGLVRRAVASGRLVSLGGCSRCKHLGIKTVWHHPDYAKPRVVQELCYACHRQEHPRPMPNGTIV